MKNVLMVVALLLVTQVIYSEKIGVLPELTRPNQLELKGRVISIMDGANIFLYDKETRQLIRSFGKEGQGPGEFSLHPEQKLMFELVDDSIFINSYNKVAFFSNTGKLKLEKIIPFWILQAIPLGEDYILTKYTTNKEGDRVIYASVFDKKFKQKRLFYKSLRSNPYREKKVDLPPKHVFIRVHNGSIFVCDLAASDLQIKKFNHKGDLLQTIEFPVQKLEVDEGFKQSAQEWLRTLPHLRSAKVDFSKMIRYPDSFPAARNIVIDGDLIFVQTFLEKDDRSKFLVLDMKGNLKKEIYLPCGNRDVIQVSPQATFDICGKVYYYLLENEDTEEWELYSMKLSGMLQQ